MRDYELVFIVHPIVDSDGLTTIVDSVQTLVKRDGGKVAAVDPWGLRRLAYPIQDVWEGQYVLMRLEMEPQAVTGLDRTLKLTEGVMRHSIVRVEG
jgi:small subunit ribosomal protein S6